MYFFPKLILRIYFLNYPPHFSKSYHWIMNWHLTSDKLWPSVANWRKGKGMQKNFKGFQNPLKCMTNVVICAFFALKKRLRAFIRFSKHLVGPLLCTPLWRTICLSIRRHWKIFRRLVWSDLCFRTNMGNNKEDRWEFLLH